MVSDDDVIHDLDIEDLSGPDDFLRDADVVRIYMENLFDTLVLSG